MQKSFWWWQFSDRYIISLSPHLHAPFPPFSPSLISLMVSVDVKHHVYLLILKKKLKCSNTPFKTILYWTHFHSEKEWGGKEERLCLIPHCHHQEWFLHYDGPSDVSFTVTIRLCPWTTILNRKDCKGQPINWQCSRQRNSHHLLDLGGEPVGGGQDLVGPSCGHGGAGRRRR